MRTFKEKELSFLVGLIFKPLCFYIWHLLMFALSLLSTQSECVWRFTLFRRGSLENVGAVRRGNRSVLFFFSYALNNKIYL